MTTLTVITPTISRPTLRRAILSACLNADDEWLVIGDGPQPEAERVCRDYAILPYLRYIEGPLTRNRGNEQRDLGMHEARGEYLLFLDDDDVYMPGAIKIIRNYVSELPGRQPVMFRMHHNGEVIWTGPKLFPGNVGGSMFCPPNVKGKLGRWCGWPTEQTSDMGFIESTLAHYENGALQWSGDIIVRCNPERI